jgi:uncharacterized protein YciI
LLKIALKPKNNKSSSLFLLYLANSKLIQTMKNLLFFFSILMITSCAKKEVAMHQDLESIMPRTTYDSVTAGQYGADDYGMKKYVMAFLKRGNNESLDSTQKAELQNQHLKNITRMAEEGKLVLAGPFMDSGELRGIYIFDVETIEEAQELTNSDPSIQAGVLQMELKEWYGSAAVMAINEIHSTLSKQNVVE